MVIKLRGRGRGRPRPAATRALGSRLGGRSSPSAFAAWLAARYGLRPGPWQPLSMVLRRLQTWTFLRQVSASLRINLFRPMGLRWLRESPTGSMRIETWPLPARVDLGTTRLPAPVVLAFGQSVSPPISIASPLRLLGPAGAGPATPGLQRELRQHVTPIVQRLLQRELRTPIPGNRSTALVTLSSSARQVGSSREELPLPPVASPQSPSWPGRRESSVSSWRSAPSGVGTSLSPTELSRLTDHVVQAIDRRLMAHRERTGRV